MYLAHIQDFRGDEPENAHIRPLNAPTSLQAVQDALGVSQHPLTAEGLVEDLFRRGYAVIAIASLQPNVIFKGRQV